MKQLILACIVLLAACGKDDLTNTTINGTWTMILVTDVQSSQNYTKPPGVNDVTITFTGNASGGKLSGHTSANTIFGEYTVGTQSKITILIGSTDVYEPQWGLFVRPGLYSASHYQTTTRGRLQIFTSRYTLTFKKD